MIDEQHITDVTNPDANPPVRAHGAVLVLLVKHDTFPLRPSPMLSQLCLSVDADYISWNSLGIMINGERGE